MDAMVTARVPAEVKEQVNALLRAAGSSPTELVNAAYSYFLQCGQLPRVGPELGPERIVLTADQEDELRARNQRVTCAVSDGFWRRVEGEGGCEGKEVR